MRPVEEMPDDIAGHIEIVFADIDDTITEDGRLPAHSYAALEALSKAGIAVAPVTGRPAGWCDMIARFWPVVGVVGENGAFYFAYNHEARNMSRVFTASQQERLTNREKLQSLAVRILDQVPGSAVASDQLYREADLAIDFCEDVAPLPASAVTRIEQLFTEAGAVAKVSSIHVNGWFGDYDKLTMCRRFAAESLGRDIDRDNARIVFVGDSPNDAPMFGFFKNSCGVANVHRFIGALAAEPAYVAKSQGADGFVEIAERLLSARHGTTRAFRKNI